MADDANNADAAAAAAAAAKSGNQATPWYEGKADAETIGHWDNKGWGKDDPIKIAIEATKAARAAQQYVGVPAERLLKLPESAADEAGWRAVHERLGAPKEAKEYDFSTIKNAAGDPIDAKLADTLRAQLFARHVAKDAAVEIAKSVVKHQDDVAAEQAAVRTGKLAEEKAKLAGNWKGKEDLNMLAARVGAERLGLTPEQVTEMEKVVGYAGVMEAMRRVGAMGAEDRFVDGGGGGGSPSTAQGAAARLVELKADTNGWAKRLLANDPATVREWQALEMQASGYDARAA